ncbi:glycoside hydrolase family 15 protein [Derxia gummosa]|uniref:Glycoside hydrolase family 15 protein n=1 Tax=Derxia gummosa DSM 723 TaxID=1121388 RepID=A0A8B6X4W3_9BURK|nr:glycoside hydrolase family 15 protein [Derxia gummosa]
MTPPLQPSLELAVIGNSRIGALIDTRGDVVWMCVPRFDGDPVFCALLDGQSVPRMPPEAADPDDPANAASPVVAIHGEPRATAEATTAGAAPESRNPPVRARGRFSIDIEHCAAVEQEYLRNTPILRTVKRDGAGNAIEILDFAPRFYQYGRIFAPVTLARVVRRLAGRPRIRVDFDPRCEYGAATPQITFGSHHIRALIPSHAMRLTTDASISAVLEKRAFILENEASFIFGPDETLSQAPSEAGRHLLSETTAYWHRWVRNLAVPFEWQDAVIRAAITLKLNAFEDSGAIIAALTTSIPEAAYTVRTWDYRYCWLRDAYFVVNALNRLGATSSMERYLHYLENIVAEAGNDQLQPCYSINGDAFLEELSMPGLAGYRGMGPVRKGNLAYLQVQHDVYGSVIVGVTHAFFDQRLARTGDEALFRQLERLGHQAWANHDKPDAGIWEFRGRQSVHTFSSMMCWAACDRLARIARQLHLPDREHFWADRATHIHAVICERAWSERIGGFSAVFGGDVIDASLLLMGELDFLPADDPRLRGTVLAIEAHLRRGDFLLRYAEPDDFGTPEVAFLVCAFWLVQALARIGETERAREQFEQLLACRNRFGLLSEDIDFGSRELWGNFPQTYSMVGIIMCAMRLSTRWEDAF